MARFASVLVVFGLVTVGAFGLLALAGLPSWSVAGCAGALAAVFTVSVLPRLDAEANDARLATDVATASALPELTAAIVTVHSVEPLPGGVFPTADDASDQPTRLALVDLSFAPSPLADGERRAAFRGRDLELLGVGDAPLRLGRVERVETSRDGEFVDADPASAEPRRMRLTVRCHADARRLALAVGELRLAEIELPALATTPEPVASA